MWANGQNSPAANVPPAFEKGEIERTLWLDAITTHQGGLYQAIVILLVNFITQLTGTIKNC